MIEKKDVDLIDPNNYRPISLTNSIAKLTEKLIKNRLVSFLDKYNILNDRQSGFRAKRQTLDNLFYFSQKTFEAMDDNQKVCGVVFDIKKAFDKIWLKGLIFKLSKLNLPKFMGRWIENFINNRKFLVKVGDSRSNLFNIETGLAQGSALSSILFIIYINDMLDLNKYPNDKIYGQLFAVDLSTFNIDKNLKRLQIQMNRYLKHLEAWLNKWRLSMAPHKCSFTIYAKK